MSRLREKYIKDIMPQMMKEFGYKNVMEVPKVDKIVINMGLGEAIQNAKVLESAEKELAAITGQKPVITKARKAIANFKLREGMPIGNAAPRAHV
jgi:large subunit ribosomal protein L5